MSEEQKNLSEKETLNAALEIIEQMNDEQQSGACILHLPSGPKCVQLTAEQCAKVKGTYVGGKCSN